MKISSIIKSKNYTINEKDTIDKALELMDNHHINGMPVVDDNDNIVGMIVKADIYRFMIAPGHYNTCPVEWVMSKSVISASPDDEIMEVAKNLRENDIISIPIVTGTKVVGIVSVGDILDYYLNEQ